MSPLEAIFFWIAVGLYGVTSGIYIYAFVFKNDKILSRINYFAGASFIAHTLAILSRWYAVGNLPVAGDYENALAAVWVIMVFYLYISIRHKSLRVIGLAILPFCLLLLGWGVMSKPELAPMTASVRSFWLYIHVFFAWLAFGAFAISAGIGVIYLLKEKHPKKDFYMKFPDLSRLDELMFRYVIFGFITDAVMIASGAIWAKDLWGSSWGWDPIETWSLVTWLIYGLSIHLRLTMGWKGRKMAWIVIFAMAGMIITFFGINIMVKSSLHIFEVWKEM